MPSPATTEDILRKRTIQDDVILSALNALFTPLNLEPVSSFFDLVDCTFIRCCSSAHFSPIISWKFLPFFHFQFLHTLYFLGDFIYKGAFAFITEHLSQRTTLRDGKLLPEDFLNSYTASATISMKIDFVLQLLYLFNIPHANELDADYLVQRLAQETSDDHSTVCLFSQVCIMLCGSFYKVSQLLLLRLFFGYFFFTSCLFFLPTAFQLHDFRCACDDETICNSYYTILCRI